jgi:tRNA U38,U39,U40 pseudouridine synthase TruA
MRPVWRVVVLVLIALVVNAPARSTAEVLTRRATTIAAIRAYPAFFNGQPVRLRAEIDRSEKRVLLVDGDDKLPALVASGVGGSGVQDLRGEVWDIGRMRQAAGAFVGFKDFETFAESDGDSADRSTHVLVDRLDIEASGDLVLVAIEGSHFLWKMVRRIVGVLAEVGRGSLEPRAAATLLTSSAGEPARLTAPASGLFLERVYYKGDERGAPIAPATPVRPR